MSRVYNFSAGPAALPLAVLETIRNDIPDWQGTGMSVMEVSHRGKHFVVFVAQRLFALWKCSPGAEDRRVFDGRSHVPAVVTRTERLDTVQAP